MALTNAQYNEIMRTYSQKQLKNARELSIRTEQVFQQLPRIAQINQLVASLSVEAARKKLLASDEHALEQLNSQIHLLSKERETLLRSNGYPANFLTLWYECEDCQDSGYIGSKKCHCFEQQILSILYDDSNIREILKQENFSTFSYAYYNDEKKDPLTNRTPLQNIKHVVNCCHDFIHTFPDACKNLIFYGETGVGKTFLTNCIAKEIIEKSYSVIYLSAIQLLDHLADATFHQEKNSTHSDSKEMAWHIFHCDLLIIDDLGTELMNTFTSSSLFNCLNERILKRKSTIISTNLSITDLQRNYSERVFSRITGNYILLKVFGEDIRMQKTLKNGG